MDFVRNFPFISIILSLFSGPLSSILNGKWAKRLNTAVISVIGIMSQAVLVYVLHTGEEFVYYMGHFPAPWEMKSESVCWKHLWLFFSV